MLYALTLSPTINFLDSGELTTVAWTLGIAHPPGYPLYTLISSAFIHLPLGDPAWRMNALSAVFAALAVGLFYTLVATTAPARPAAVNSSAPEERGGWGVRSGALTAAGLVATSLTFWNWATQAKMYTLHFAFVAALFGLALHARRALVAEAGDQPHPPNPSV